MMLTQNSRTTYAGMRKFLVAPLLMLTAFIFSFTIDKKTEVVRAGKKMTLVLDAAHGGHDNGGKGANGIYEKDLSLRICRTMMALAPEYNINIVATREDDVYPKLQERLDLSNRTDADVFVSLHVNSAGTSGTVTNDYEVAISNRGTNYKQSLRLASAIVPRLKPASVNPVLVQKNGVMVIRDNKHAAVLIEFGDIDNAENIARIADKTKREEICRGILAGIVDYGASK